MSVSLIATVLNEGDSIRRLMESIVAQTRQPDEVVICDGGSTDNTVAVLHEYADRLPLTVITRPGANISEGRNAAIAAAAQDVIAVTDAGVRLHPDWLARLVAPLEAEPDTQVAAGFFLPDPHTPFEVALAATTLPAVRDINPATFMPSSRSVAFRRAAVQEVGGYPEWIDFCEDLILDFRLAARCGAFAFVPGAVAYFRPRPTLRAFVKQYYQYARGDGKADLFLRRHLIRYLTYFVALPLIVAGGVLLSPLWLLALVAGGLAMVVTPYRRLPGLWGDLSTGGKLVAALWVPVVRVAGDLAKMAGYPVGRVWRARNQPPRWREDQGGRLHAVSAHLTDADERHSARLNIAEEPSKRRALASLVTHSGDVLPYLILLALLFVLGGAAWRFRTLALLAADTLTFLVVQLLKVIIRRIRPEGKWGEMYRRIDPYSFPSGHAARGGAMAAMGLFVGPLWFGAALAVWGLSLAVSRVVLGVHYLSDAVAGFTLGVIIAVMLGLLVL